MTFTEQPKVRRFGLVVFLIAHGTVHAGIWALPRPQGQQRPFDPSGSWLMGSEQSRAALLAIAATVLLVAGGSFLWAQVTWWRPLTVIGLAVSFVLMSLFFNPWFLPIQVVNAALIVGILRWSWPLTSTASKDRATPYGVLARP